MGAGVVQNNYSTTDYCRYGYCVPTGYTSLPAQVSLVIPGAYPLRTQVKLVAYNTTQLRVLWEIQSDGITASNYSASTTASTDKGVLNLKNDIVEKYWQSTGCTDEYVQFDAGAGQTIAMDTFALISHNLTSSAVVTLQGYGTSTDAAPGSWTAVPVFATLAMPDDPTETNLIYVAPTLPLQSFRHWRVRIQDPTNPAGVVKIGRLVGGSALIFNGENCLDTIDLQNQNFKDEMQLNGFTRISNNRALKKALTLKFENLDRISQTNYRLLKRYLTYCRDTLKALVIVDPSSNTSKYQFTVFAKLKDMPKESHVYVDQGASYTTFTLDYDEGK